MGGISWDHLQGRCVRGYLAMQYTKPEGMRGNNHDYPPRHVFGRKFRVQITNKSESKPLSGMNLAPASGGRGGVCTKRGRGAVDVYLVLRGKGNGSQGQSFRSASSI